ncbi:hypothetical protein HRG_013562 [Hirsutella rhossiliensis]
MGRTNSATISLDPCTELPVQNAHYTNSAALIVPLNASQMLCQQAFNHLITGEDVRRTDQNTVQQKSLQPVTLTLDSPTSGQATIKFGNGEAIHSIGSIAPKTPVRRMTFHILQTPTPFLLSLADTDRLGNYFDNISRISTAGLASVPSAASNIHPCPRSAGRPTAARNAAS